MSRYIDREDLLNNLKQFAAEYLKPFIVSLIEKQPTADVKEVKHGQWSWYTISKDYYIDIKYVCSQCHYTEQYATDFCPNCGAQMDEEVVKE